MRSVLICAGLLPLIIAQSQFTCPDMNYDHMTVDYFDKLNTGLAAAASRVKSQGVAYVSAFHDSVLRSFRKSGCTNHQFPMSFNASFAIQDYLTTFRTKRGNSFSDEALGLVRAIDQIMWFGARNHNLSACISTVIRDQFLKMQQRCAGDTFLVQTNYMDRFVVFPDVFKNPLLERNMRTYMSYQMAALSAASACKEEARVRTVALRYSRNDYCGAVASSFGKDCVTRFRKNCKGVTDCFTEIIENPDPYILMFLRNGLPAMKQCNRHRRKGAPTGMDLWNKVKELVINFGRAVFTSYKDANNKLSEEAADLVELLLHVSRLEFNAEVCNCAGV